MEKHEVDNELMRLSNEGHSLKSNEIPSKLYRKAVEFYGSYTQAKKTLNIDVKYSYDSEKRRKANANQIKWTEDLVVQKAIEASKSGLTKTQFYNEHKGITHAIRRIYGDLKDFEKLSGVTFHKAPPKYSDEELILFVTTMNDVGNSGAKAKAIDGKLFEATKKRWGSWNKALVANGFEPRQKTPRKDWTKDEVRQIYLSEIESGVQRQNVSNQSAITKLFGGITQLRKELGLDEESPEKKLLSRVSIDCYMNQALKMDVDNVNEQLLDELDVNLTHSIKHYYGSTSNYFSIIDIDRYKKPYTPFTWTKENVVWQLERWIREGYPVNYTAIQSRHKGIIVASRRLFGSYKKAFEYAGLNYDDYRIDTAMASRQGAEFENVIAEILTDLGIEYLREPSINGCHPDFVIGEHWIDAKLSEWTVSFADCSTIHKYTPHCRRLTIVYLRKLKDETIRTNELGIDMIHVSELLKELPEDKAYDYQRKLDAILDLLKENAA